ncbi:Uncharacterised protein [Streptococcus criceti]|uniref:Uncharacterized protein n=1 Tax=Streptococcus criceti HS-6 TaxID=873449 RepID=G5JN64_STRCG|nr:hypothetical protein [Streptococcus criceti]EHI73838.1 hypothetical protein STRCR_1399 [Streptococcus criceti HS-6]SUN43358.1 Uncharacterised protein [Streptococcus criceti]
MKKALLLKISELKIYKSGFKGLTAKVGFLFMISSQFFSERKTRKPLAKLVADKDPSFHLFLFFFYERKYIYVN